MSMLRRHRWPLAVLTVLLVLFGAYEVYATYGFYRDLSDGRDILGRLEDRVDLDDLNMPEREALQTRADFLEAGRKFREAQTHINSDPLLNAAKFLPFVGKEVRGLDVLIDLGAGAAAVGYDATGVLLAYSTHEGEAGQTSLQSGLNFLEAQASTIERVDEGLERLFERRADLPAGLSSRLRSATQSFDKATAKLARLVSGYNKAYATLPSLLGRDGPRTYLVLPQNDAELLPSGGLISSYGIATFNKAQLESMQFEYFGTLYDRWQTESGGEYIEPPGPLKNYLKRHFSWGLGEAGWYPDFPTTAGLARMFVEKGGAPPTDGVIALDQQFVEGLLELVGPVEVPEYDIVISSENLIEKTLELTRDDQYEPGRPKKAFLSFLAQALIDKIFAVPKEDWVAMLELFDEMSRERHLQLNFEDAALQAVITEYGFDGSILQAEGDYVMLVDASVNSTKLNIVLETAASIEVQLNLDGSADTTVSYQIKNPYDEWKAGRDPELMRQLMLDGVYGSYTRIYAPLGSRLAGVYLDGLQVGAEQIDEELGKQAFGRFFPVRPGETRVLSFSYRTPVVVGYDAEGAFYNLYIQKEAGMRGIPLRLRITLPDGGRLLSASLDGEELDSLEDLSTDLTTDRVIELRFEGPAPAGG